MLQRLSTFIGRGFLATLLLYILLSLSAAGLSAGDGPAIGTKITPAPHLSLTYYWNLESRRDGPYALNGPNGSWAVIEDKLESVDVFLFGMYQAFMDMDISEVIDANHLAADGSKKGWVSIYSTTTNYPFNRVEDDPPHVNVHTYWPGYDGDTNAHFTVDTAGQIKSNWYANHHSASNCGSDGRTEPEPGEWVNKIDSSCQVIFQERFTADGEAQFRIGEGRSIYTLRNEKIDGRSHLSILLEDELIYTVERTFHDATMAKVVFEIEDIRGNSTHLHTLEAEPDSGELINYSVESIEDLPELAPLQLPPGAQSIPQFASVNSPNAYFVSLNGADENPGTMARPWQTFEHATEQLKSGDTLYIRAGTYTEMLTPKVSGTSNGYITYAAFPNEEVTLDGQATSGGAYGAIIDVDGLSYVRVSGLRVINAPYYGFRSGGNSSHIIFDNNELDFIYSSAFYVSDTDQIVIDGNDIQRTTHGIGAERFRENDGTGVAPQEHISIVSGATNFEVRYNRITNPYINQGYRQSKEGIDVKNGAQDGKVYGNYVAGIRNMGIYVDGYENQVSNVEIFNNTLTDNQNGIVIAAERRGQVNNIDIYNNVVYENGYERTIDGVTDVTGGTGIRVFSSDDGGPTNDVRIYNNTVVRNRANGITVSNPELEGAVVVNNIVFENSGDDIFIADEVINRVTVTKNLVVDPLFEDIENRDFRLTADSPAINGSDGQHIPNFDARLLIRADQADLGSYEFGEPMPLPNLSYVYLPFQ